MFIVTKEYLHEELRKYNEGNPNKLRAEDFYGIYLVINGKLTNYLPFEGKILGDSRNNNISNEGGQKNNGRFRMILKPDKDTCKNSLLFDALINTCDIKALTGFLDKSPWKQIKTLSMSIFKGDDIIKKPTEVKSIHKVKITATKDGGVYLVYLGNGLWKFGLVKDYDNMDSRLNDHKNESISKIEEFIDKLNNKLIPKQKKCYVVYSIKTSTPNGCEEKISKIMEEYSNGKITLLECERSSNTIREYFVCDDFDYISESICNLLVM